MAEISVQWNYTTVLNIIALAVAAALCYRFVRTGGLPMLKMMGGAPGAGGEDHVHAGHEEMAPGSGQSAGGWGNWASSRGEDGVVVAPKCG